MQHYDQRPFAETVCDAIIANGGVKKPSKNVQNVCDDVCIKHGSGFSCVCDEGHTVNPALLTTPRPGNRSRDSCDPIGVVSHRQCPIAHEFSV